MFKKSVFLIFAIVTVLSSQNRLGFIFYSNYSFPKVKLGEFREFKPSGSSFALVKPTFGLAFSVLMEAGLTEDLFLRVEPSYAERRVKANGEIYKISYIEVPIVTRFILSKGDNFDVYGLMGLNSGWFRFDISLIDINVVDFLFEMGLGLNYSVSRKVRVLIEARYMHGLREIPGVGRIVRWRSRELRFGSGLMFVF